MKNQQEIQQQAKQRQEVQNWDPATLIATVREGFYEIPESHRESVQVPLEEALSRLDQGCRALGTVGFAGTPVASSSASR